MALDRRIHDGDRMNLGCRGKLAFQAAPKIVEPVDASLELDLHPVGRVLDPASQAQLGGQPNHEGAEANALHPPEHPQSHRRSLPDRDTSKVGCWGTIHAVGIVHFLVLPDGTKRGSP